MQAILNSMRHSMGSQYSC